MQAAYVVGMGIGAIMAVAATYVLVKEKKIGLPSLGFTALGVLLIGMSVWSQFRIEIGAEGAVIEAIRRQVEETAEAVQVVAAEVEVAADAIEVSRAQFYELANVLERNDVVSRAELQRFVPPAHELPSIDRERLDSAVIRLDRVNRAQRSLGTRPIR